MDIVISIEFDINNKTLVEERMQLLAKSDARIFLLYATVTEAVTIFEVANRQGLTGTKFMWIMTQSVVGNPTDKATFFV